MNHQPEAQHPKSSAIHKLAGRLPHLSGYSGLSQAVRPADLWVHGLIDFDPTQFHPELKGVPDPKRGDQDRIWRCVSWGAGSRLADAFLAHVYRLLFGKQVSDGANEWKLQVPTIARAKLAVAWTVDHVRRYNTGLVGGKLQLAVLEKRDGTWIAHHEDPGETEQQVASLEKYVSEFRDKQQPDAAAEASEVDLDKALAGEAPTGEGSA